MPLRLRLSLIIVLLVGSVISVTPPSTRAQGGTSASDCSNGFFAGVDGTEASQPYPTILTGEAFDSAIAIIDPNSNQWQVAFSLTVAGGEILLAHTSTHIDQQLAIVLDGQVLTAPVIQAALSDQGVITGNFTAEEARALALQIESGALALRLELVDSSFTSIGPYGITRLQFRADLSEGMDLSGVDASLVQETLTILERRLNGLGLTPSRVSISTDGSINVMIRATSDQISIVDSLIASGLLEFVDYSTASYRPEAGACILTEAQIAQEQQYRSGQPAIGSN